MRGFAILILKKISYCIPHEHNTRIHEEIQTMAYSDILKLKKVEVKNEEKVFIKNLIVGNDIFAMDLFDHLYKKDSTSVKLLTEEEVTEDNFKVMGPSLVRGENNISVLRDLGIIEEANPLSSCFYKDSKFHDFGSRTKPMPLLWGEESYIDEHIKVRPTDLLPSLNSEGLLDRIRENSYSLRIKEIYRTTPEELIDQAHWKVYLTNGLIIECENLYWGESPAIFLDLFKDKKTLSTEFIEFCESTKTPCSLYVHLDLEEKITDDEKTYFFPLSFTHEWGHFIGEIGETESEGYAQTAKFVTFIDKEESTEEDISKKINLLKKNLAKNFDAFDVNKSKERVILRDYSYSPEIDDSKITQESLNEDHLIFFSFNAPLRQSAVKNETFVDSWMSSKFLARGLAVQSKIK